MTIIIFHCFHLCIYASCIESLSKLYCQTNTFWSSIKSFIIFALESTCVCCAHWWRALSEIRWNHKMKPPSKLDDITWHNPEFRCLLYAWWFNNEEDELLDQLICVKDSFSIVLVLSLSNNLRWHLMGGLYESYIIWSS